MKRDHCLSLKWNRNWMKVILLTIRLSYYENTKVGSLQADTTRDDCELWLLRVDPSVRSFIYPSLTTKLDISTLSNKTISLSDSGSLHEGAIVGKHKDGKQAYTIFQTNHLETETLVNLLPKDGEFAFGTPTLLLLEFIHNRKAFCQTIGLHQRPCSI